MRHARMGIGLFTALLSVAGQAQAGGAFNGGRALSGGFGGCCSGGFGGGFSGTPSGGVTGSAGFGGLPSSVGMSGFSGFTGMCGFSFGGCCGGFYCPYPYYGYFSGNVTTQTFSQWAPSPGKKYYYRFVHVHTPTPNETAFEYVLVHHPSRPKFFYYYEPLEKKYFGRYELGTREESSFALLPLERRKGNLNDIPNAAYRTIKGMPLLAQVYRPKSGGSVNVQVWQNVRLQRPPEYIPDELLGLPPEEDLEKKKTPAKK